MLTGEQQQALVNLSTPLVADAMYRLGLAERVLDPGVRPAVPFCRMAGTAVTVQLVTQPDPVQADLTTYTRAFESGAHVPFPLMVVEVPQAHRHQGIFGEGCATLGRRFGFVGALLEGAVRDTPELQAMAFPVFSRSVGPGFISPYVQAVSAGQPVCVGGVSIARGEIVLGDNDGVVVIAPEHLDAVLAKGGAIQEWEHRMHALMAEGCPQERLEQEAGPMP